MSPDAWRVSAPIRSTWSGPTGGRSSTLPPNPVDGVLRWSSVLRKVEEDMTMLE